MQNLNEIIISGHEDTRIDFKLIEYKKPNYSSLLKDIISMANSNAIEDRFIIIGMKPKASGDRCIIGVDSNDFTDAATYQQLVFENIEPELGVDYYPYQYEEKILGVLRIYKYNNKPYLMKKAYNSDKGKSLDRGEGFIRIGTTQRRLIRSDYDLFFQQKLSADVEIKINDVKDKLEQDVYFQRELISYELDSPFPSSFDLMVENISKMNEKLKPFSRNSPKNQINRSLVELKIKLYNIGSVALENVKINFNFKGNHLGLVNTNIVVRNKIDILSSLYRTDPNRVEFTLIDKDAVTLDFHQMVVVGGDNYTSRIFYIVAEQRVDTNIEISWELLSKSLRKTGIINVVLHPKIKDLRKRVKVDGVLQVKKEYLEIEDWIEEED